MRAGVRRGWRRAAVIGVVCVLVGAGCLPGQSEGAVPGLSEGVVPESGHLWWEVLEASGVEVPPVSERGGGVFVAVSVGWHGCGLRADGSVHCWGHNRSGQTSPPEGVFKVISAGYATACGIPAVGPVECWGGRSSEVPPVELVSVAVGWKVVCGVLAVDGSVECWGDESYSYSGDDRVVEHPDGEFASVKGGFLFMCAMRRSGELECWGEDEVWTYFQETINGTFFGGLTVAPEGVFVDYSVGFQHACGLRRDGQVECWGNNSHSQSNPPEGPFVSVSAGDEVSCGLRLGGQVECWGAHRPPGGDRRRPPGGESVPAIAPAGTFVAIDAGPGKACGINFDGAIECWAASAPARVHTVASASDNDFRAGFLPVGWLPSFATTRAPGGEFVALDAYRDFTCALGVDGGLACWGQDFYGQSSPPLGQYTAVTVGHWFGCALTQDTYAVVCWGNLDRVGEPPEGSFTQISAGSSHVCGLRGRGTVECWGYDYAGETTPPPGLFTTLSAGRNHTCGLRPDATVHCWGIGTRDNKPTPPGKFTSIASEGFRSCGIRPNGTAECWYYKNWVSLEHPDEDIAALAEVQDRYDPPPGTAFTTLTIGDDHTCGIRADDTAQCWPQDGGKPLTLVARFGEVLPYFSWIAEWWDSRAVPLPGEFTTLAAGEHHTCGIRLDRTIDCWSGTEPRNQASPTP